MPFSCSSKTLGESSIRFREGGKGGGEGGSIQERKRNAVYRERERMREGVHEREIYSERQGKKDRKRQM
jgi:hypothetical protein